MVTVLRSIVECVTKHVLSENGYKCLHVLYCHSLQNGVHMLTQSLYI